MTDIDIAKFTDRDELFKFLKDNRAQLIAQKKFEMKRADAFSFTPVSFTPGAKDIAAKDADTGSLIDQGVINATLVINTTGLLDSHGDVHIKGLWNKSVRENKSPYHLQEHEMKFANVISDSVKAYTKEYQWRELGYDADGTTEALVFLSEIRKDRNPYMFEQYARGRVKNHSVGMRYVTLYLCVNSDKDYYEEEKANWDKYISHVINVKDAEAAGYFWAVTEAKMIEGSAVLMGSNWITPTQEIKRVEPPEGTSQSSDKPAPPLVKRSMFEITKTN